MDHNEASSAKFMSLLPNQNKATFSNLIKQFFFHRHDIGNSNLLNHNISEDRESKYFHRGLIFLSLLIQISLKHLAKPLEKFGFMLEVFLNRDLIVRGKEGVSIDEESEGFISFLGHLDMRLDLDKEIKQGDERYYPALSMMAAKLAYENESVIKKTVSNQWNMEYVDFYDCYNEFMKEKTTQAFIMCEKNAHQNKNDDKIILAFRGTSPFKAHDWSSDFDFSWLKIDGMGKLHKGFMMALGLKKYQKEDTDDELCDYYGYWPKEIQNDDPNSPSLAYYTIREKLRDMISKNQSAKIIITGHSLGGALAILFPAILALHGEKEILDRIEGTYTYGQPRVGNEKFGEFMKEKMREHKIKYFRVVYSYDVVPTVPLDNTMMTFKHFGPCLHFNSLYHGKIIKEEQREIEEDYNVIEKEVIKYISVLRGIIFMIIKFLVARLIAVWQLIRGCIMVYTTGQDYKEGWALMFFRIIGILFPGVADHNPHDYVNLTRLASEELFIKYSEELLYIGF